MVRGFAHNSSVSHVTDQRVPITLRMLVSRAGSVEWLVHYEAAGFEAGGFEEVLGEAVAG